MVPLRSQIGAWRFTIRNVAAIGTAAVTHNNRAGLDETLAAVQAESTVDDSIIALLTGIKAQLDAVLAGGLTADAQAKVDAIFAAAQANSTKVAAAVTANTPAAP